jgi:23S rRNA (cytidine2498-2'-O)-methyltransferase
LVEHVQGDGFTFSPKSKADWMVCDIVEQPSRVARLCAQWIARSWCERTIFNLKLPMKKRFEEICRCKDIIAEELKRSSIRYSFCVKHLYHDREEVTGFIRRI